MFSCLNLILIERSLWERLSQTWGEAEVSQLRDNEKSKCPTHMMMMITLIRKLKSMKWETQPLQNPWEPLCTSGMLSHLNLCQRTSVTVLRCRRSSHFSSKPTGKRVSKNAHPRRLWMLKEDSFWVYSARFTNPHSSALRQCSCPSQISMMSLPNCTDNLL